jgi:hypothetical protein
VHSTKTSILQLTTLILIAGAFGSSCMRDLLCLTHGFLVSTICNVKRSSFRQQGGCVSFVSLSEGLFGSRAIIVMSGSESEYSETASLRLDSNFIEEMAL